MTKLQSLRLGWNNITTIQGLNKLTELKMLTLGNNNITEIKGLSKLTELRELRIHGNDVGEEIKGVDKLAKLRELHLSLTRSQFKIIEINKIKTNNPKLKTITIDNYYNK